MKKAFTTFALIALAGTFANAETPEVATDVEESESVPALVITIPELTKSASIEVFSAKARSGSNDNSPDMKGVMLTYGLSAPIAEKASIEFGGFLSASAGDKKWTAENTFTTAYDLDQTDVMLGLQGGISFHATEEISIFAGAMAGIDYRTIEVAEMTRVALTDPTTGAQTIATGRDDGSDTTLGLVYGIYVGIDFKVSEKWSVMVSYRYMGSTAENDVELFGVNSKLETDEYSVISVGAKYTF